MGQPLKLSSDWIASLFPKMTAVERTIKKWKRAEVALHLPVEESVVVAKLSALGRSYSRDVLGFLQQLVVWKMVNRIRTGSLSGPWRG